MKTALLYSLLLGACAAQVTTQDLVEANSNNWLSYSGSYSAQRHTSLKQINTGNVANLAPKWIYHIQGSSRLESVPVVVNGVMYVSHPNEVYALDARSGRLIWQYTHAPTNPARFANRGVAVYGNKVYGVTPDAHLIALDARTGNLIWETKIAEVSDGYRSPAAPLIAQGKVIVGIAAGDWGMNGFLDAYDGETGKRIWRWDTIPKPGEPGHESWAGDSWKTGGADTWLTGSYDPQLNLIYWGIGNPAPDFDGEGRKGDNLYSECMVALDPDTGKLKWYFQFTPHDVHDWDAVEIPVLVDEPLPGGTGGVRKLLVQANRNGYYYVLDRTDGKFLHGSAFVKLNWADGLTPEGRPIRVRGVEPTLQGNKVCPATSGATNWMSPAYNPATHYFYVVAQEGCGISFKAADKFRAGGLPFMATGYVESPEEPWQMYVRALNVTTGKLAWEYKQVGSKRYGAGLLSTAGGLLFATDDQGYLTALDALTGKPLWHFNTGNAISASPMSYSFRGQQYIALLSGTNVIAFGLPDPGH